MGKWDQELRTLIEVLFFQSALFHTPLGADLQQQLCTFLGPGLPCLFRVQELRLHGLEANLQTWLL